MNAPYTSFSFWAERWVIASTESFGPLERNTLMWANFAVNDPSIRWYVRLVVTQAVVKIVRAHPLLSAEHVLNSMGSHSWDGLLFHAPVMNTWQAATEHHLFVQLLARRGAAASRSAA